MTCIYKHVCEPVARQPDTREGHSFPFPFGVFRFEDPDLMAQPHRKMTSTCVCVSAESCPEQGGEVPTSFPPLRGRNPRTPTRPSPASRFRNHLTHSPLRLQQKITVDTSRASPGAAARQPLAAGLAPTCQGWESAPGGASLRKINTNWRWREGCSLSSTLKGRRIHSIWTFPPELPSTLEIALKTSPGGCQGGCLQLTVQLRQRRHRDTKESSQ